MYIFRLGLVTGSVVLSLVTLVAFGFYSASNSRLDELMIMAAYAFFVLTNIGDLIFNKVPYWFFKKLKRK